MRILERYVLMELLRVFTLVVSGLTLLLVVVGVVGEAAKSGLGPEQIAGILPYIVPSLLPFTIPATLLLTVCVVYGRMAGDHEIMALKAAGINVLVVLLPSFILAAVLSLGTFYLTDQFIPWARGNIERVITMAMEDIFLDVLRSQNQFADNSRGIAISVARVEGKTLISPVFRYTPPGGAAVTITAQQATLKFDMQQQQVVLNLKHGHVETPRGDSVVLEQQEYPFPLPIELEPPKARNIPIEGLNRELAKVAIERERLDERQIIQSAFALLQGEYGRLSANELKKYDTQRADIRERYYKFNTEVHSRLALACSCFFFTLLGTPFAVLQGRRQFLSSFALCFIPILTLYYPVILVTMNLGKDGIINPQWGMWLGNAGMLIAGMFVLRKVVRH